ncbi:MAG: class aldolase/adducin family protein [Bacillota bacterium]|jgi:L-fuculose-phosphate aldolase|nr:class aldolase/adducin family protein [Bacillota bacterium]
MTQIAGGKMEPIEAKQFVVKAGFELVRSGLIARTWGNVSCRIDEKRFAITPSGRDYQTLTPEEIVEVEIQDLSYSGSIKPSSEKGIHASVYRIRPDINFVIHTHQENASALSATDLDYFRPVSPYSELSKTVVCAKYALPGTKTLCKNATAAMEISSGNAVILKHHGTLCIGSDYQKAFLTASQLEDASGAFLNANGAGIQVSSVPAARKASEVADDLLSAWNSSGRNGVLLLNTDFDVVRFSHQGIVLKPLLDDFAQIVGTRIKTVENDTNSIIQSLKSVSAVLIKGFGAVCWGSSMSDAEAVSMILRKNCKAFFAAQAFGLPNYIKPWEALLMRTVYLKKYAKMDANNKRQ